MFMIFVYLCRAVSQFPFNYGFNLEKIRILVDYFTKIAKDLHIHEMTVL